MTQRSSASAIIDLSSGFQYFAGVPDFGVYPASKTFNHRLAMGYREEMRDSNIDIMCLMPGFVTTNMTKGMKNLFTVTVKQCVSETLKDLGRKKETHGPLWHLA